MVIYIVFFKFLIALITYTYTSTSCDNNKGINCQKNGIGRGDAEAIVKRKFEGSSRENIELVGVSNPDFQGLPTGNPWRLCMGGKLKRK